MFNYLVSCPPGSEFDGGYDNPYSDDNEGGEDGEGGVTVRERNVQVDPDNRTGGFNMMSKGVSVLGWKIYMGS